MVEMGVWKEEKDQRRKYESSRASAKCTTMSPRRFICDLMQAALLVVSSIPIQTEGGKGATVRVAPTQRGTSLCSKSERLAAPAGRMGRRR